MVITCLRCIEQIGAKQAFNERLVIEFELRSNWLTTTVQLPHPPVLRDGTFSASQFGSRQPVSPQIRNQTLCWVGAMLNISFPVDPYLQL